MTIPDLVNNPDQARVLVVEDDRLLRALAVETLLEDGISATGVGGAIEALAHLESTTGVDLLITDINMPGMSGTDLANIVQQSYPNVQILLISGREQLISSLLLYPFEFLQKPFSANNFLSKVKDMLGG